MKGKAKYFLKVAAALATLALIALLVIDLYPLGREVLDNVGDEAKVVGYIQAYGWKGVPVLLGLEVLQIVVAVIPEAAVNVLSGLCYGVWWGALIGIVGIALGNVVVFVAMRQLKNLLAPLFKKKTARKGGVSPEMLSRVKHPELIAFFFFLIPAFPNGMIPYVFAQTKISLPRYLLAVMAGLVPSTLLCTFFGDRLSNGNYTAAIIAAAAFLLAAAIALLFKNKILAKLTKEPLA